MKKYKVTLHLMVDPTKGDQTFPKIYEVEAENKWTALAAAEKMREREPDIRWKSVFNYVAQEIK